MLVGIFPYGCIDRDIVLCAAYSLRYCIGVSYAVHTR